MEIELTKILSLISFFTTKTSFCGRTKLAKLLFYCDWTHLKATGRSITGLQYLTYEFGPLPKTLNDALRDPSTEIGRQINYDKSLECTRKPMSVRSTFDPKMFTKFELEILDRAVFIFKDVTPKDMVKASHWIDQPWTKARAGKDVVVPIDERMAFSEPDSGITLDEYEERIADINCMDAMLYGAR